MKGLIVVLILACLAVGIVVAQEAISVNAVGYVRNTFPTGAWTQVQIPFDEMSADAYHITNVFGSSLPDGTTVWWWNPQSVKWEKETYAFSLLVFDYVWTPGTNVFGRGQGLFVQMPDTAPSNSYTVSFIGEVPGDATTDVELAEGYTMIGNPYPASVPLTNSAFGLNAVDGDQVWAWNPASNKWEKETYAFSLLVFDYVWTPGTMIFEPNTAFFYESVTNVIRQPTKPYSWP